MFVTKSLATLIDYPGLFLTRIFLCEVVASLSHPDPTASTFWYFICAHYSEQDVFSFRINPYYPLMVSIKYLRKILNISPRNVFILSSMYPDYSPMYDHKIACIRSWPINCYLYTLFPCKQAASGINYKAISLNTTGKGVRYLCDEHRTTRMRIRYYPTVYQQYICFDCSTRCG